MNSLPSAEASRQASQAWNSMEFSERMLHARRAAAETIDNSCRLGRYSCMLDFVRGDVQQAIERELWEAGYRVTVCQLRSVATDDGGAVSSLEVFW